jgi:type III secretion protein J
MRHLSLFVLLLALTGCIKNSLHSGLSESEAQEMIVLLKMNGIDASRELVAHGKETPTWTVSVRGGNQNQVLAWRILQENGLPRQRVKGLEEVFSQSGLIPTASEEKAKLLVGLTGEMTRTLKMVEGIVDARVHVVLPENSPLLDKSQWSPPTASVFLKYRGTRPPLSDIEIKTLVAKGVEGLNADQVVVVAKPQSELPKQYRDVTWSPGNQEVAFAAVIVMLIAAVLAVVQSVRLRALRQQIAAMRADYARRESAAPAARS